MNETLNAPRVSWIRIAIKYGLLTGLASAIMTLMMYMTGTFGSIWIGLVVGLTISVGGIVLAHREFKQENGGLMTYGQGLLIGTTVSLIAGVIAGLAAYCYIQFVDPNVLEEMKEVQIGLLEKFGMPEDQMDKAIEQIERENTAEKQFTNGLKNGLIGGFILSLIVSAFTKKKRPEFE